MKNIKNTETSSPHYWRKVNKFIIQNTFQVTGITLEILVKESKLKFQLKILQLQFLTQLSLTTEQLQIPPL